MTIRRLRREPGESSRWRATLHDKALELVAASARLDHSLPTGIAGGLARLVRSMNCYSSNITEGPSLRPNKIERGRSHRRTMRDGRAPSKPVPT